jgi:hypothetical protein
MSKDEQAFVGCGQLGHTGDAWPVSLPMERLNEVLAWKHDGTIELIGLKASTDALRLTAPLFKLLMLSPVQIALRWTNLHQPTNNQRFGDAVQSDKATA